MRRAPIVIGATIAGLAGVLSFHTRSASLALGSAPGASATGGSSPSNTAGAPPSASTTTHLSRPASPTTPSSTTAFDRRLHHGTAPRPRGRPRATPSTTPTGSCRCRSRSRGAGSPSRDRLPRRRGRLPLPVDRPAVDSDPRAAGVAGAERQHPRGVRCQLHQRGLRESLQSALGKLGL